MSRLVGGDRWSDEIIQIYALDGIDVLENAQVGHSK